MCACVCVCARVRVCVHVRVHVYILGHFAVQHKLTEHCKSTKKRKKEPSGLNLKVGLGSGCGVCGVGWAPRGGPASQHPLLVSLF